jgi:hypothetical protein
MTVVETVLVFGGIPLGAFALLALAVLGPGAARAPRYRPGGAWDYRPVWYLPHAAQDAPTGGSRRALEGTVAPQVTSSGGASGEW